MKTISRFLLATLVVVPPAGVAAPWLEIVPQDARPGDPITLRGGVAPENTSVRAFWDQAGRTRPLGDGTVAADGTFGFEVTVPTAAASGLMSVGVVGLGSGDNEFAWTEMNVLPAAAAGLTGVLGGGEAGVEVRLLNREGNVLAQAVTGPDGGFAFGNLPAGDFTVQPEAGEYPPGKATLGVGEQQNVMLAPIDLSKMPPVMLVGLGAIALPGGSYPGPDPVQVGYWGDVPFARLLSLPGKGRPPLNVRVWARVQQTLTSPEGEIEVVFRVLKGSKRVRTLPATQGTVFGQSPFNFQAWRADFNSLELPQGPLTLEVAVRPVVVRGNPPVLGEWQYPLEVTDFGPRWYAGAVKDAGLKVGREDFYRLRYEFTGAVPAGPGIGTPLFDEPMDLEFVTLDNRFDLGIALKERFTSDGAWWGQATGKAGLTLFGVPVFEQTLPFAGPFGASLVQSGYQLEPPLQLPLPAGLHLPVWGAGLPTPIHVCGFSFHGQVGIFLDLAGSVSLNSSIHSDLRVDATLTPGIDLALPTGASIEAGPCEATAQITPAIFVGAPIVLDPWGSPPVSWDVCVQLSGKANASLSCCGIGFGKSVDLFDPIKAGDCPGVAQSALNNAEPPAFAPPLNASLAFSPAGQAAAVWENYARGDGEWLRSAPLISFRRDGVWDAPQPVATEDFAGWEPQVAWLDDRRVVVTWVCHHSAGRGTLRRSTGLAQAGPTGVCDTVSTALDLGCSLIGGAVDVVVGVFDSIFAARLDGSASGATPELRMIGPGPVFLTDDEWFDGRPVLASDARSGEALLVWLREQDPAGPTQRPLALYFVSMTPDGWTAPSRLDPDATTLDIQPSVRFDRNGVPAVVWLRDGDGNLGTALDRRLMMSSPGRLGFWSAPSEIPGLPDAAWTPSLDFDLANDPVVAFTAPPVPGEDGVMLPAAGMLSAVHVARRRGGEWSEEPVGAGLTGERPVARVGPDNRAMVVFRGFGLPGRAWSLGAAVAATADLSSDSPVWNTGRLGAGANRESRLAAEFDPETGEPLILWEERDPLVPESAPELREDAPGWLPDLAVAQGGLTVSNPHPNPGELVTLALTFSNQGLAPLGTETFEVHFFDREPLRGTLPFATAVLQGPLGFGEAMVATARYVPADRLPRTIHALLDGTGTVSEMDESNNAATVALGGLPPVVNLAVTAPPGGGRVELEWENPITDGSVQHWIWRARTAQGPFELVGGTTDTRFVDQWRLEAGEFIYQVVTLDPSGARSNAALSAPVNPPGPPPPDGGQLRLAVFRHAESITVTWTDAWDAELEISDALVGPGTRWSTETDGILRVGGSASLTTPLSGMPRFFRLAVR